MMKYKTIDSFVDFHNYIVSISEIGVPPLFRGVKNKQYELVTKLGRLMNEDNTSLPTAIGLEKEFLSKFRREALPHLDWVPQNDWEWIFLAQHHGLPTRLLDWTVNPLVALYFAVEKSFDGDSAVYVLDDTTAIQLDKIIKSDVGPFDIKEVRRITPPHVTKTITAQHGRFTLHPVFLEAMDSDKITKLTIKNKLKQEMKQILHLYGIYKFFLFPDLDSLSEHIISGQTGEYDSKTQHWLRNISLPRDQ